MRKNKAFILLIFLSLPLLGLSQMYSWINDYSSSHTSDSVLIRVNQTREYFVKSFSPNTTKNCFMVDYNSIQKWFNLNEIYEGGVVEYRTGYIIKDMRIIGHDCYFCGSRWTEYGELMYTFEGLAFYQKRYDGFIGRFNMDDVINGNGEYGIMAIPGTQSLERIVVYPGGVTSLGTLTSGGARCIVEVNSGGTNYYCRIIKTSAEDEVLMDITHTYDKVVTVSRYNNPNYNIRYQQLFGLRYGTAMNFYGHNIGVYNYDTYDATYSYALCFDGVNPIVLSATHIDDGVVVSYLGKRINWIDGQPILYRIDNVGNATSRIQYSTGAEKSRRIKEVEFNFPMMTTTRMTMLFESDSSRSLLRFPYWGIGTTYYDTVLYNDQYDLYSIAPFQYLSQQLDLAVGGIDRSDNRIMELRQFNIHDPLGLWTKYSCMKASHGEWRPLPTTIEPVMEYGGLYSIYYVEDAAFDNINFESHSVQKIINCSDGH
ncbi:MAG: hypothetical protein J6X58_02445 [Bacteroidales bacterium]|nr:hypothetical protein [Bacteroidales bacterium]